MLLSDVCLSVCLWAYVYGFMGWSWAVACSVHGRGLAHSLVHAARYRQSSAFSTVVQIGPPF